ncbi:MAG: type II secretion system GspH family protein [Campylobacter sp.]|uniref:type II secretion system protein n=1 Tax=Campylobacter sp. TaxID=205 RepID=UPI002AA72B52|nr:type II secretion system protein [Campylobacter sp.]MCI6344088.1 type II secretion system GspH family protein [Campylobacter sp.]MCI7463971.1 type II secretion system GspH family protein [Campylobacter sp.]
MKKGFTMIELIFVIVILGILASVAIPRLAATREDAEISAAVANLRTLVSDATAYYTVKGSFNTTGGTAAKWSDITNVPLEGATKVVTNTGAKLKAGGGDCIAVQLFEKNGATPAHILITKEGSVNNVCTQVLASEPLKAYFSSTVTGITTDNSKGAIAIGSSTSVYPPAPAPKPTT